MEEKEGERKDYKAPSINSSLYKTRTKTASNVLYMAAQLKFYGSLNSSFLELISS
jgi:hypothetical protein